MLTRIIVIIIIVLVCSHFGPRTLRSSVISVLGYFGTSTSVLGHFGPQSVRSADTSALGHFGPLHVHFVYKTFKYIRIQLWTDVAVMSGGHLPGAVLKPALTTYDAITRDYRWLAYAGSEVQTWSVVDFARCRKSRPRRIEVGDGIPELNARAALLVQFQLCHHWQVVWCVRDRWHSVSTR